MDNKIYQKEENIIQQDVLNRINILQISIDNSERQIKDLRKLLLKLKTS